MSPTILDVSPDNLGPTRTYYFLRYILKSYKIAEILYIKQG